MNTTTNTTARRAAATVVLAGAAVLVAAPAFAGVPPEDTGSGSSQTNAQAGGTGGLSPQTRSKVEQMERANRGPQAGQQPAGNTSNPSDPSSVPVTALALLGGTLIAGAAGFTVYRFRHHGPIGAATA
ncbi:MAG: hypothetical protein QOD68_1816 [Actinomycetota bacterium]|nr:hypothetical protein [Actinomycetota bacterium]